LTSTQGTGLAIHPPTSALIFTASQASGMGQDMSLSVRMACIASRVVIKDHVRIMEEIYEHYIVIRNGNALGKNNPLWGFFIIDLLLLPLLLVYLIDRCLLFYDEVLQ
jgi:hypothetical protein